MINKENKSAILEFIESFFLLFKASIKSCEFDDDEVFGIITWHEDDAKQEFAWKLSNIDANFADLSILNHFLASNNCMKGDKIAIPVEDIVVQMLSLGWNVERTITALKSLCGIKIAMVDKFEITDYFYVRL